MVIEEGFREIPINHIPCVAFVGVEVFLNLG
jgi:hypothetical protein